MSTPFPAGRRAFLVIHGIGEQNPFETLDSFARGLIRDFQEKGIAFTAEHHISERTRAGGGRWTENWVRLKSADGTDWIDLHEYYWAYLTEEKIGLDAIWRWARQTLQGAARFFKENKKLQERFEARGLRRRYGAGTRNIKCLLTLMLIASPLFFLGRMLVQASQVIPPLWAALRELQGWLRQKTRLLIVGYVGDVAIYTTMDEKSRYYALRQHVLAESQALLEELLASEEDYDQVIVAGHSLGSVIAYDTLNRLNIKSNLKNNLIEAKLKKLAGLITFGSPLDKIAFFFREHPKKDEYVRRQILKSLHSFKAIPLQFEQEPLELASQIEARLDGLPWANYFDEKDPVSGHLDFYAIPDADNVELHLPQPWGVAHTGYWGEAAFYRDISRRYLGLAP